MSLKIVFGFQGLDADASVPMVLWDGIRVDGWSWIKSFSFTSDNWLLSIVPFDFLAFFVFGQKPWLVIFSGWLSFALAASVSGLLAYQLRARRAAFILPVVLLLLGSFAQTSGFMSYVVSHDITNLYGLMALSLLLGWLSSPKSFFLIVAAILLSAGSISDPWMVAAYDIPIVMGAVLCFCFPTSYVPRHQASRLLLVPIVAIVLARTHAFSFMEFLPNPAFKAAGWSTIANNLLFLIQDLGGLLNIIPGKASANFLPALVSLIVVGSLIAFNLARILLQKSISPKMLVFFGFTFLSCGATCASFVLINIPQTLASARFLPNVLYLVIIVCGVLTDINWLHFTRLQKATCASVIALFFLSNSISTFQEWSRAGFVVQDEGIPAFISFLSKNGLTYGYGPYHGAQANSLTVESIGKIRLRPVHFNPENGMMQTSTGAQTSSRWYTSRDAPPDQKYFFVAIMADQEACPDPDLCVKGVETQFGPPVKILSYGTGTTVLVWNHPLLGYPYLVAGDYWGGNSWAWMGRSLTIESKKAISVSIKGTGLGFAKTNFSANVNGQKSQFSLGAGEIKTIAIPANAFAQFTTDQYFVAKSIFHNKDRRKLSALIDLPQPAP